MDATRYLFEFGKWLGARDPHNASLWVEALFLTTVETLRDLQVATMERSWTEMTNVERRAIYADVVRRVYRNRRPPDSFFITSIEEQAARVEEAIERILDFLMARDEELPFEPICG